MKTMHVVTVAMVAVMMIAPLLRAAPAPPAEAAAAIVPLTGQIDDYSRDDLIRRFEKAKALGAKVVVVEIDSPGGLVTSSLEISRFLKRQDVHTIAFIKDKAYSGAAMVSLACNEIWMSPASVLGDCAPIVFDRSGSLEGMPATERAKAESPVVDDFLDSARRNGYNSLLAVAMVTLRQPVYVLQNDQGKLRIVSEQDYKRLAAGTEWKLAPGYENVDGPDRLVTVHPEQAIPLKLAKGQIASAQMLVADQGYRLMADLTPGIGEKLVEFLNNPFVRMILLTIFLQSLYIAMHAPGHGAAEAVAVVSLGLLIGIPLLTGYAQWWEVAVIFIGLALCAFEIFVFPGHMVSLIVGTLMVLFGLIMTFAGKEPTGVPGWLPSLQQTWNGIQHGLLAVVCAIFCWILLSMWLRRYLPSIPYFNRLILTATAGNLAELQRRGGPKPDVWPFIGTKGRATTDLKPGGIAEFPYADGTRTTAVVASGYVPAGALLVVEEASGHRVSVRAL